MANCVLQVVKDYQTLLVGLLGFTGVITTMLANAKMQRNQHERALLHEARSARVAIKTELLANKKSYELRISQLNEPPDESSGALVPSKLSNQLYNELLPKLGILSEEELEKVIQAYALISEAPYRLRILVGTDNVIGLNGENIRVESGKLQAAKEIHERILVVITKAIELVESHLENA